MITKQLTFDLGDTDLYPQQAMINNFCDYGFDQLLVQRAFTTKNNRVQVKKLSQTKKSLFYLPLRSQSFGWKPSLEDWIHLYQLDKFFRVVGSDTSWGECFKYHEGGLVAHTLDSVIVQRNENGIGVNLFISARQAASTQLKSGRHSTLHRFKPAGLKQRKVIQKVVAVFDYILIDSKLFLSDNSYLLVISGGTSEKIFFTERLPGTGLPFLFNYFCLEKLNDFFSSTNLSQPLKKYYIDGIAESVMRTLVELYSNITQNLTKMSYLSQSQFFDSLIFQQAVDVPLLKDMFPETIVLRSIFANTLRSSISDITPFDNKYANATVINMLTVPVHPNDVISPFKEYFPNSRWAIQKTMQFWKKQSVFFYEEGWYQPTSVMNSINVLRQIHRFYCIYHKLFSDNLEEIDAQYSTFYLRCIVYDYDWMTETNGNGAVTGRNGRTAELIDTFYNCLGLVAEHLSIIKVRRMFYEFFEPFDMSCSTSNKYPTVDNHIALTLLPHWAYLDDFIALHQNITTHTEAKDRWVQDFDWRNYTTLNKVHDVMTRYMKRFKYPSVACTNSLYEPFKTADLAIPDTKLVLKIAKGTGEVSQWGETQHHCLGQYASKINSEQSLLFGVWDTDSNTWWGHCYMTTEHLKDFDPKVWKVYQFLGLRNSALDNNIKKAIIAHVMNILYPTKEKEEVINNPDIKEVLV